MPEVPLQPELPTMSEEQPEQPALTEDIPDTQTQESEKLALKVTKIQRREITFLPRCEWQAANNHFLMHGYCNYRHLVLIDDGKTLKLGVPGIMKKKPKQRKVSAFRSLSGWMRPDFIWNRKSITLKSDSGTGADG